MKKKLAFVLLVSAVIVLGIHTLYAAGGDPGPPCEPDPLIQCPHVWDPVHCVKPSVGWKTYSNGCYAMKDCALLHTCRPGA